ncbi:uncharacterized protein BX663DRAFT_524644 [Cokeromyces recurvatus]|uniref:uncharacterized protein n=1 Tax=Cokeromyces recurvatus TaxID=90255 RepID=UPI00221F3549|nr:uncharacterized protein BX663DRAFT_524644 [Cokeromyces recurvatus]KAI7898574.1 hypothetical protein BX663DRAFT_524644 [Cokeromyces recurvatus]
MRIKINTVPPLPKYTCWYPIPTKVESQTIHQLRQMMVKNLKLNHEAASLILSMDGFTFLPQLKIKDLVRDGDLISIKIESVKQSKERKRKTQMDKDDERDIKKARIEKKKRKEEKKQEKGEEEEEEKQGKKKEKEEKKQGKKKEKEEKKKRKEKKKKNKIVEKKQTKVINQQKITLENNINKSQLITSVPFEGTTKTKKRNLRRKLLKKALREKNQNKPAQQKEILVPEQSTQNIESKEVTSLSVEQQSTSLPVSLLKKNKNKKKNHLKKGKAAQQENSAKHVHFEELNSQHYYDELYNDLQEQSYVDNNNLYGRAFVTFAESQPSNRNTKGSYFSAYEYPVNKVPTLFYAEEPTQDNEIDNTIQKNTIKEEEAVIENEQPVIVNYDEYPDANFESNVPSIGDHLAIKVTNYVIF